MLKIYLKTKQISFNRSRPITIKSAKLFSLIAYLGLIRKEKSDKEGWLSLEQISRLPLWKKEKFSSIGKMIQRYIKKMEHDDLYLIEYEKITQGPYRLKARHSQIEFDVLQEAVRESLHLASISESAEFDLEFLLRFTAALFDADSEFLDGKLSKALQKYKKLLSFELRPLHKLIVLYRICRSYSLKEDVNASEATLNQIEYLIREQNIDDPSLIVPLYIERGWLYHRLFDFKKAKLNLENAHRAIKGVQDLSMMSDIYNYLGLAQARLDVSEKGVMSEKGLEYLARSLHLRLNRFNYDDIQKSCFNIGNCLYIVLGKCREAIQWIALSIRMCNHLNIGYDISIGYITLASILGRLFRTSSKQRLFKMWKSIENDLIEDLHIDIHATHPQNADAIKDYLLEIAEKSIDKGLGYANITGSVRDKALAYAVYAGIFEIKGQDNKVVEYLRIARDLYHDASLSKANIHFIEKQLTTRFPIHWPQIEASDKLRR